MSFLTVITVSALTPTAMAGNTPVSSPSSTLMTSPEGYWLVYSKKSTGAKRSVVHLTLNADHSLSGSFGAIFYVKGHVWDDTCRDCVAPFHGKPLLGMTFLWGLKHSGTKWNDDWSKGRVFNPDSNQTYNASLRLTNQGHSLRFTGCKLMICRSSTWTRVDEKDLPQYMAQSELDFKNYPFSKSRI